MELLAYVLACSIIIYQVKEDVEISCWFLVLLTSIATLSGSCLFVFASYKDSCYLFVGL